MALGSIEEEIWSGTRLGGFGLIEPHVDGRFRLELHTRAATASSSLSADDLQATGTFGRLLGIWQLGPVARTPIDSSGTELFGAAPADSLTDGEVQQLRDLAARVASIAVAGEPPAVREQRLARIEALDDVLRALAGTLDVREVFGQLSEIARRVLPHDSALIFNVGEDRRRVKMYALNLPEGLTFPEEVEARYPQALIDAWQFGFITIFRHIRSRRLDPQPCSGSIHRSGCRFRRLASRTRRSAR
jgi:hypothetical protein